jgi:hypothetical protein
MDDDAMLRAMADENLSQFGKDSYPTYREAITAAVERMMARCIAVGGPQELLLTSEGPGTRNDLPGKIVAGGCPGEDLVQGYFKGSMSLPPIRTALQEYRETGRLAAWHAVHSPDAIRVNEPPTLSAKALAAEHVRLKSLRDFKGFELFRGIPRRNKITPGP